MTIRSIVIVVILIAIPIAVSAQFEDDFELEQLTWEDEPFAAIYTRGGLWENFPIPVCWETVPEETAFERRLVRQSVDDSWARHSAVSFSGWELCPNNFAGIRITVSDERPWATYGKAIAAKRRGMILNFRFGNYSTSACSGSDERRYFCIRAIAVHEFGHALGFAHEHNRNDRPEECNAAQNGPDPDLLIGEYDPFSVMNYCNLSWSSGVLSATDIRAAVELYGPNE